MKNNNLLVFLSGFLFNDKNTKKKMSDRVPSAHSFFYNIYIYMGGKGYKLVIQTTNCRDETKVTFVSNREEILTIN
jgi:hypothetical protein